MLKLDDELYKLRHDIERSVNAITNLENYIDELHDKHQRELEQKDCVIDDYEYEIEKLTDDKQNTINLISELVSKLITIATNNVTSYSQQDNDIWSIKQELEKIMEVELDV